MLISKIIKLSAKLIWPVLKDAVYASLNLFKIMIPIIIAVKILQFFDLIRYLAIPLKPVMSLVGLPAEMGLVWATTIMDAHYSAIVVFLSIIEHVPMTTAQITILATMMMIAHSLPIELRLVQKAGLHLPFQAVLRLGAALLVGMGLNGFYSFFDILQGEPTIFLAWNTLESDQSLYQWGISKIFMLINVFFLIFILMLFIALLKKTGFINIIQKIMTPLMKIIGTSDKASTVTVIGLCLGLTYGSGLILNETKAGGMSKQDVFGSLSLMGLNHAVFEETILMKMLGADLSGILFVKMAFSILLIAVIAVVIKYLPLKIKETYLWQP